MIVPATRLLIGYAVTVPILALLPALGGVEPVPVLSAGFGLALVALLDAAWAPFRMRGIGVSLPAVVRMTRDRESSLELAVINPSGRGVTLRLGVPLPPEFSNPREDLSAALPEGAETLRVSWPCTPVSRGRYRIDRCYLEIKSPLGLWACRASRETACEIRVYPNLARERKNLAALFLNRGGYGVHARRQHGKGREFEKLREYIPGDGYDEIHWKATAKRRYPITKVFQIERTQDVYVIIDLSRLSARPAATKGGAAERGNGLPRTGESCLERFIAAALVVGLAAQKQGDLFGVLTFSDSVHDFLRAGGGRAHYSACREHIFNLHPRMVNPDYEELSTFIRLRLRRRALIILLTSLDDPVLAESFTRAMEIIYRHHLVLVNMFRPAGARPVFSNPAMASQEEIYTELSGHTLWHSLRELGSALSRWGVHLSLLDQERLCVDLVGQYMTVKQRQLL